MQHITAPELAEKLAAGVAAPEGERPLLLDVRENWEFETCHIAGSTQIPMHLVPIRAGELPDDREIVCICHHGARTAPIVTRWRSDCTTRSVMPRRARPSATARMAGAS